MHLNPNAIEEARKIDKLIRETPDKSKLEKLPLIGVPFTAKDSVKIPGMRITVGLVSRANQISDSETEVITKLRQAGAIPIGITNTPELLIWWDAENRLTGRTNNPYDLSRIPGGSTGGCASLIASGASILSVASDIGGSTRIPANFCGVFGHKTTSEVISSKGKYPEIDENKLHLFSFGPICRYAKDLRPCLAAMAGKEAISEKLPNLFKKANFSKSKIFYMEEDGDPFKTPVQPQVRKVIQDVCKHFQQEHGVNVTCANLHKFRYALNMWRAMMETLR